MSGFFIVNQSPPSFDWCSVGLQSSSISPYQLRNDLLSNPVYISTNGVSPSVYLNKKGTWTYSFVKTGATTGTTTGTVASNQSFSDAKVGGAGSQTNYALTITDSATGINHLFNNLVVWGSI
jgi:hypothetical protein